MNRTPLFVPDNDAAWKALPPAACGSGSLLPVWGRLLALSLPRTTAALLQLDYLHRAASPLDPVLRSKLRYEVATVNRSFCGQAIAVADLRRAGLSSVEIDAWRHDELRSGFEERLLLGFARTFSLDADSIEDHEIAGVISRHGIQSAVAIALHLAFANLHDRILTGLPLEPDSVEVAPPVYVRFDLDAPSNVPIPEWGVALIEEEGGPGVPDPAQWRQSQTSVGGNAGVLDATGDDAELEWDKLCITPQAPPLAIVARFVALGHQRQMATEWSDCVRSLVGEVRLEPRFSGVVNWVNAQSLGVFR